MDKLAAISNKRAQINALVINHIRRYAALNDALDDLIRVPSEEMAAGVDSVFNAIASVPLLFMIARVGNNKNIMGPYKNGRISNVFVHLAFAVMAASVLALFYFMIVN